MLVVAVVHLEQLELLELMVLNVVFRWLYSFISYLYIMAKQTPKKLVIRIDGGL